MTATGNCMLAAVERAARSLRMGFRIPIMGVQHRVCTVASLALTNLLFQQPCFEYERERVGPDRAEYLVLLHQSLIAAMQS